METEQNLQINPLLHTAVKAACTVVGLAAFVLHWHVSGRVARSEIDNSNYSIDTMMIVTGVYALITLGALIITIRSAAIRSKALVTVSWGIVTLLFGLMTISIFSDLVSYASVV